MTAPSALREYTIGARSTDVFGRVLVNARDHHFVVDGPVRNGCPGEEVPPPELLLAAVASCGVELVSVIAREEKVPIAGVEVAAYGMLDRSKQSRGDVTVYNAVKLDFVV